MSAELSEQVRAFTKSRQTKPKSSFQPKTKPQSLGQKFVKKQAQPKSIPKKIQQVSQPSNAERLRLAQEFNRQQIAKQQPKKLPNAERLRLAQEFNRQQIAKQQPKKLPNAERLRLAQEFNRSQIKGTGKPDFVTSRATARGDTPKVAGRRGILNQRGQFLKKFEKQQQQKPTLISRQKLQRQQETFNQKQTLGEDTVSSIFQTSRARTVNVGQRKRKPRQSDELQKTKRTFANPNRNKDEINKIFDFRNGGKGNRRFF